MAVTRRKTATLLVFGGNSVKGVNAAGNQTNYATLTSDRLDYSPGMKVVLTGTGWQPNETVQITMSVDPNTHSDVVLTSQADSKGNFINSDYTVQQSDLGVTFYVTSVGLKSGKTAALLTFTDGTLTVTVTGAGPVTGSPALITVPAGGTCTSASTSCTAALAAAGSGTLTASSSATWTVTPMAASTCPVGTACSYTMNGNSAGTIAVSFVPTPTLTSVALGSTTLFRRQHRDPYRHEFLDGRQRIDDPFWRQQLRSYVQQRHYLRCQHRKVQRRHIRRQYYDQQSPDQYGEFHDQRPGHHCNGGDEYEDLQRHDQRCRGTRR